MVKRGAEDAEQQAAETEAAAAKRVKLEQEHTSNGAAGAKHNTNSEPTVSEAAGEQAAQQAEAAVKQEQQGVKQEGSEEEDDAPIQLPVSTTRSAVRKGHECPYLDTILRQVGQESAGPGSQISMLQLQLQQRSWLLQAHIHMCTKTPEYCMHMLKLLLECHNGVVAPKSAGYSNAAEALRLSRMSCRWTCRYASMFSR